MSDRSSELAARREALRARCMSQRNHLGAVTDDIHFKLGGLDRRIESIRTFVGNPAFLAGGIAVLTLIGPRRLIGWASRAAVLATSARRILRWLPRKKSHAELSERAEIKGLKKLR